LVTTSQDKPNNPLLDDALAAVKVACEALTTDHADLPVAVLAGMVFVGTRVAGAIVGVGAMLDRRLEWATGQAAAIAADSARSHAGALREYAHTVAAMATDTDDPDGSGRPH
jgi:hypothetical protein